VPRPFAIGCLPWLVPRCFWPTFSTKLASAEFPIFLLFSLEFLGLKVWNRSCFLNLCTYIAACQIHVDLLPESDCVATFARAAANPEAVPREPGLCVVGRDGCFWLLAAVWLLWLSWFHWDCRLGIALLFGDSNRIVACLRCLATCSWAVRSLCWSITYFSLFNSACRWSPDITSNTI
jgi:hypothetical protein